MSNDDKTADLIESLSGQLEPVKTLAHPLHRIAPIIVVALVYVALVAYFVGIRGDMFKFPSDPVFVFEIVLGLSMALSAFVASAWCCVPDMRGQNWLLAVPITLFYAMCVFQGAYLFVSGLPIHEFDYIHCIHDGWLMVGMPMAIIMFMSKKGASTKPKMQIFMNVLAVTGLGYVGLRFTCAADHMDHIFMYHTAPFILAGLLFGLLARRFYAW